MQGKCKNCGRIIDETEYTQNNGLCLGCLLAAKEQWDKDVERFHSNLNINHKMQNLGKNGA